MTLLEDVRNFIKRLSPDAVCDDCITERLGLSLRQHVNRNSRELAGTSGIECRRDACSLCGKNKIVVCAK